MKINCDSKPVRYEYFLVVLTSFSLQTTSRQAILNSKRRINDLEKRNRDELFGRTVKHNEAFIEQFELKQRGVQRR